MELGERLDRTRWRRGGSRAAIYVTLALITVVMLYPFYYMGFNAFRSLDQYYAGHGFSLTSWRNLFTTLPVGRQLLNSTIITMSAIAIILAVSTTAGYAFAVLAMVTIAVLQFIFVWDDLLVGLLFLQSPDVRPITVGLATIPSLHLLDVPQLMAGSLISALPAVIVYLFFQRYLITGLTMGISK